MQPSSETGICSCIQLAEIAHVGHLNLLFLLGVAALAGTIGARVFQRLHIPQVVGSIVIGILIGGSGFNLINPEVVRSLAPFNIFALGIIGFMIGGELEYEIFKKHGRHFFTILLCEGLFAFGIVAVLTSVGSYLFTGDWVGSISLGLVLGAIASATAPAATVDVLWEYKTRGILTRTVLAIVALDDGLALLIYGFASSTAGLLMAKADVSVLGSIFVPVWEILGAVVLGVAAGLLVIFALKYITDQDKILTLTIAAVLLVVGLSMILRVESILAAMLLGATLSNLQPRRSQGAFSVVEKFSPPIYVLFFVFVGARLEIGHVSGPVLAVALAYVLGRTAGKFSGSWFGAWISRSAATVRRYLGLCLFSQAGVAIGLSILASERFGETIGDSVILIVTVTTFVVQIFGPPMVKVAVKKAGEIGLNVTEEDLIKSYKVKDMMDSEPAIIRQDVLLDDILEVFSESDSVYYPVVDDKSRILGVITIADIKEMFANRDVAAWLLAIDVAEPVVDKTTPETALEEAIDHMVRYHLEHLPVVLVDKGGDRLAGVLDHRKALRKISAEVLRRRKRADEMAEIPAQNRGR